MKNSIWSKRLFAFRMVLKLRRNVLVEAKTIQKNKNKIKKLKNISEE